MPASAVHLLGLQNPTPLTNTESEIILRKHSSGVKLCLPPIQGKNNPLYFFIEALALTAALRIGPSTWLREVWHPVLYATHLFMGRMLCPSDPCVNPAMWSKSWHQSGEESCLFSHCFWWGWYDWRQTSHLLGSHTTRKKSKSWWCHVVCLIPIKSSISMKSWQSHCVCYFIADRFCSFQIY